MDEGARFEPQDPEYRERIRASFGRQAIMCLIGASLHRVAPGEVEIALPYREDLTQQDGFLHAGVVTTIMDSACGYAAYTLMPAEARVLSVEFKVNLLAPATGAQMLARARVIRPGRTITVCYGEVFALGANAVVREGAEPAGKLVATMMATLIAIMPRG